MPRRTAGGESKEPGHLPSPPPISSPLLAQSDFGKPWKGRVVFLVSHQHPHPHRNGAPPLLSCSSFSSSHTTQPLGFPIAKLGIIVAKHSHFESSHFRPAFPNKSHTGELSSATSPHARPRLSHLSRITAPRLRAIWVAVARRRRHASWAHSACG